jgi:hypothetical protein
MEKMNINTETFRTLLKLQEEIDEKIDQYVALLKQIDDRGTVMVELDGEIWQLRKVDYDSEAMRLGRKYRGFYHDYRLVKLGKPVK